MCMCTFTDALEVRGWCWGIFFYHSPLFSFSVSLVCLCVCVSLSFVRISLNEPVILKDLVRLGGGQAPSCIWCPSARVMDTHSAFMWVLGLELGSSHHLENSNDLDNCTLPCLDRPWLKLSLSNTRCLELTNHYIYLRSFRVIFFSPSLFKRWVKVWRQWILNSPTDMRNAFYQTKKGRSLT